MQKIAVCLPEAQSVFMIQSSYLSQFENEIKQGL